jgi:DNA-binding response OmpR family regulator
VPVVLVGDALPETERILALESGASDYICEPFSPGEASARIKVHLRRPWDFVPLLRVGTLEVNRERRQVRLNGRNIALTPHEFRILETLMTRVGAVFSERQLLERCWGQDTPVREGVIKAHILRLRRKLGDDAMQPRIIRSVRGFGYSLEPSSTWEVER